MYATRGRLLARVATSTFREAGSRFFSSSCVGNGLAITRQSSALLREELLPLAQRARWASSSQVRKHSGVGAGSGGRSGGVLVRNPPATFPFSVKGLNHIAIAVPDLEAASEHYRTVFGATVSEPHDQPDHGVTVVFVHFANSTIELLHPLGESSPIANFLEKNPKGGLHHICLTVDDIRAASKHMQGSRVGVLGDGEPKLGAHNNPVLFLHPKDNNGVLFELEQASCAHGNEKDVAA